MTANTKHAWMQSATGITGLSGWLPKSEDTFDSVLDAIQKLGNRFGHPPQAKRKLRKWKCQTRMRVERFKEQSFQSVGIEHEIDGLRISCLAQVNFVNDPDGKTVPIPGLFGVVRYTGVDGTGMPERWVPYELELLEYDNERKIDRARRTTDPTEALCWLLDARKWLVERRADLRIK